LRISITVLLPTRQVGNLFRAGYFFIDHRWIIPLHGKKVFAPRSENRANELAAITGN
jgi:hypothetical protein